MILRFHAGIFSRITFASAIWSLTRVKPKTKISMFLSKFCDLLLFSKLNFFQNQENLPKKFAFFSNFAP